MVGWGGEVTVHSKLTRGQVIDIINSDIPINVAATKYNITVENANSIRIGESWVNIDMSSAPVYKTRYWITEYIAQQITNAQHSWKFVMGHYNISSTTVRYIRDGNIFPDWDRASAPEYDDAGTPRTITDAMAIIVDVRGISIV